MKTVPDETVLY